MRQWPAYSIAVLAAAVCVGGCASDNEEKSSMRQRQDDALKDPFSYGPAVPSPAGRPSQDPNANKRDESVKGEWDRFWTP